MDNNRISLKEIVPVVLRGIMNRFPSEITIGDYKLNCFYTAMVNGSRYIAPTFQQITLNLEEWTALYGLDHIAFSLWEVNGNGVPCKIYELTNKQLYYVSIYKYLTSHGSFVNIGTVQYENDSFVPVTFVDDYKEIYKNEVLFRFFKDAPAWYSTSTGIMHTRRTLELIYGNTNVLESEFYNRSTVEPANYEIEITI